LSALPPLPIDSVLPPLQATLQQSTTVVVQAPPGAGKSTRLPLALLDAPWLDGRRILMLEPRRLAARAVATWMAQLLGESVGARVGYRMRLDNRVSRDTRIEVVTEGILTRMLQSDPALEPFGCVIFDEFHERSLHADLGLTLCLDAQAQLREDLRIIVMSATLDAQPIATWLGDAPVITAEGRSFPVETRYVPRASDRLENDVCSTVRRALRDDEGDMLVFLPGVGEIRRAERLLGESGTLPSDAVVLPLYGDLEASAQQRAIAPARAGERKIVLSTSVAETSLTIDGVRIVIDGGYSRRARFDPVSGMTRLITTRVARSAADQRRGRAGRVSAGVCYRLWSEDAGKSLDAFTPAEITEADLCPLALELAGWGISDPLQLRWLTPPPPASFAQARELLAELGALDSQGRISAHGRAMNAFGTHPRLAHMLLKAHDIGLGALGCEVAALLGERDLLRLPPTERAIDMRMRVEALRGIRDHLPAMADIDRGGRERARRLADNYRQQLGVSGRGGGEPADIDAGTGALIALAYPDRIGRLRNEQPGRYQLTSGRGAIVAETDALARQPLLAIAELDAGEREARVFLAAPVSRQQLGELFADRIRSEDRLQWDARSAAVIARREQRLDALVLEDAALTAIDPARAVAAMIEGIRALGIDALPWTGALRSWQQRVLFLRQFEPERWPDVCDPTLLATLEDWLAPYLDGITRRDHLARVDLAAALRGQLDYAQQRELDEQAPTHLTVPSGSSIALDYQADGSVILAARLQEMFGLGTTPTLARGRATVLIHLLSPAGRPLQVTRDLAGFWRGSYQDVKKDMKGRYPRHHWPDDPLTAVATRKAKPRRT
jgi:ATP-dependent helicase HrpB